LSPEEQQTLEESLIDDATAANTAAGLERPEQVSPALCGALNRAFWPYRRSLTDKGGGKLRQLFAVSR
jgi:hypothetical protein